MERTLVSISLSPEGLATIKAAPELRQAEMRFIHDWKEQGLLEHFFITTDRTGAFLLFQGVDGDRLRGMIEGLPYFPYMAKVEYVGLDKQF
ncbi:MAG TPA: muconolactone Delta-isomerase family protein [Flavobacteriales bacterium]